MKRLFVLVLALAACSAPESGTITEKDHRDAFTTYTTQCSVYISGTCRSYTTVPVRHAESWRIRLCEGDDCGWRQVPESEWETIEVGDHWELAG